MGKGVALLIIVSTFVYLQNVSGKKITRKLNSDIPPPAFPQNECRIIFNEINLYPASDNQYIELSKYCKDKVKVNRPISMEYFKIVVIAHNANLLAVCSLDGFTKHEEGRYWFYTIGGTNIGTSNFRIQNCEIDEVYKNQDTGNKQLPIGAMHPIGIALLYSNNINVLKDIKMDCKENKCTSTFISELKERKIMQHMQDFYVFGSSTMYQSCTYFEKYYANYNAQWINILRDFQDNQAQDRSLNRCSTLHVETITLPMQPAVWVYSTKTPNQKNLCSEGLWFVIETQQHIRKRPRADDETSGQYKCVSITEDPANEAHLIANPEQYQQELNQIAEEVAEQGPNMDSDVPERYRIINEHNYFGPVELDEEGTVGAEECEKRGTFDVPALDVEDSDEIIDYEDNSEEALGQPKQSWKRERFLPKPLSDTAFQALLNNGEKFVHDDCTSFPENVKQELQLLPGNPIDIEDVLQPDTCSWFEWLAPEKQFRCKFCNLLLNQKKIVDNFGSPDINYIMWRGVGKLTGVNRRSVNRDLINKHKNSRLHKAALYYFKLVDEGKRGNELQEAFESKHGPWRTFLNATENLLITGFQSVKMGISFRSFSKLTDLLRYFGNDIGTVHSSSVGITKVVEILSDRIHADFIEHLLSSDREVSLICDAMTDISGDASFAVLLQTYDKDENIKVYMYRLLHACEGETGMQLFELLKNSLEKDGIDGFIKKNLIGFAADGGANIQKTFKKQLSLYISNELIAVHCMNHRIELISKHCFEQFSYLLAIDRTINELFRFFTNKSAKRKAILRQWSFDPDTGKVQKYELKRIIEIRWINSKKRAMTTLLTHWNSVVEALEDIAQDKTFKFEQRQKSLVLADRLKDPTFLATIHFALDVSTELASVSVALQRHGNTMIGKKAMRTTLINRIELLKSTNGPNIKSLLKNSDYYVPENQAPPIEKITLKVFETQPMKYGHPQKVPLEAPSEISNGNRLFETKDEYINAMIEQVDLYFPTDPLDTWDIFDISNWPSDREELKLYGSAEISIMTRKLKWDVKWGINENTLRQDWNELKSSVSYDPEFQKFLLEKPEVTWAHYLKKTDSNILWTPTTRKVISNVITVSCSSASAEHIFSIYSAIKTKQRFSLLPETVEKLVRLRYYSEQNIQNYNFLPATYDFVKKYSKADDRSRRTSWKKTNRPTNIIDDESDESDFEDPFDY